MEEELTYNTILKILRSPPPKRRVSFFIMAELNKYSKTLTQDPTQPAAQAMYYAIGFKEEDFSKAQVGIVSMGWDGNPCNMHLNDLAVTIKKSVDNTEGLIGLRFYTIGVSDAIS